MKNEKAKAKRSSLPYKKDNDAQRTRWNRYSNEYANKNFKTITLKLSKKNDADIVKYLEESGEGVTHLIKRLLRKEISGK